MKKISTICETKTIGRVFPRMRDAAGWTTAVIGSRRKTAAAGWRGRDGARAFCMRDRRVAIVAWSRAGCDAGCACAVTFLNSRSRGALDLAAKRYGKK